MITGCAIQCMPSILSASSHGELKLVKTEKPEGVTQGSARQVMTIARLGE